MPNSSHQQSALSPLPFHLIYQFRFIPLPYFNLPIIIYIYEPYRAITCRERELTMDHIHTFSTTQGHGGPLRMRDQLNVGVTSETTRTLKTIHTIHSHILTRQIWSGWLWWPNDCLKLPDICLTGEEKPRKNLTQVTCPDRGLNPGPLRNKRACYRLLHSDA